MIDRRDLLKLAGLAAGTLAGLRLHSGGAAAAATPAIKALKPGEYLWYPKASPDGPVVAIVSLPEQLIHVYRNGIEIGVSTVSTGKKGHRTPTGVFTILQKNREHYSNLYDDAPMPFMQRLTWSGVAIHAGNLPGYPASHGCVRVPFTFSKLLFSVTRVGTSVIIADEATAPVEVVQPGVFLSAASTELLQSLAVEQEKKAKAPKADDPDAVQAASILVSARDRRGYLFRNGRLEMSMPVTVLEPERQLGTHLYSFMGLSADKRAIRWMSFGLLTDKAESGSVVTRANDDTLARLVVKNRARLLQVADTLSPGTTMVVTDVAASPETRTGPDFVVLTAGAKSKAETKPAEAEPAPEPAKPAAASAKPAAAVAEPTGEAAVVKPVKKVKVKPGYTAPVSRR